MKKNIILLSLIVLIVCPSTGSAEIDKMYPYESGIIKYSLTGAQSGEMTIYFKDWGNTQATYTESTIDMFGVVQESNSVAIVKGDYVYSVDLDTNTALKMNASEMKTKMMNSTGAKNQMELSEKMIEKMGGVKIGERNIVGRTCDLYDFPNFGTQNCIWEGIALSTDVNMGMSMQMEVVDIQENAYVPDEKFELPEGVVVTDAPSMMEAVAQFKDFQNSEEFNQLQTGEFYPSDEGEELTESEKAQLEEINGAMQDAMPKINSLMDSLGDVFN